MTEIESKQNSTLRHLARLAREKKYRRAENQMLCEGEKLLREAVQSGAEIQTVLVREQADDVSYKLLSQAEDAGAQLFRAPDALFAQACDAVTPQGVVFSCRPPAGGAEVLADAGRVLLLEGVQDPGNLGTILRTADAFAVDAVILSEGCADETAPKVVRATMGAMFRLPMARLALGEAAAILRQNGVPLYAAALTADATPVGKIDLSRCAIIVGSEGHGVSADALALCDHAITLPMAGRADSLNAGVAAAILMWEMTKTH